MKLRRSLKDKKLLFSLNQRKDDCTVPGQCEHSVQSTQVFLPFLHILSAYHSQIKWSSRRWVRDVRRKEKDHETVSYIINLYVNLPFIIYRQQSCSFVKGRAPSQLLIKQPRFKILQKMRGRKILRGGGGGGQLVH